MLLSEYIELCQAELEKYGDHQLWRTDNARIATLGAITNNISPPRFENEKILGKREYVPKYYIDRVDPYESKGEPIYVL